MGKFLLGVVVGILVFFLFVMFGGGMTVKKVGENLTQTGKKMEIMEETIKRQKEAIQNNVKKKFLKEGNGAASQKSQ